jgi:hypothetical protein
VHESEANNIQEDATIESQEEADCPWCDSKMAVKSKDLGGRHLVFNVATTVGVRFSTPANSKISETWTPGKTPMSDAFHD